MSSNKEFEELIHNPQESIILEILKQKFGEAKSYITISVTSFTVYLAVNGALLKYSFEKDIDPLIPIIFSIIGIATSTLYVIVSIFKIRVRGRLASDVEHLNKLLGNPLVSKQFPGLTYIGYSTGSFSLFGFIGWVLLLVRFVSHQ